MRVQMSTSQLVRYDEGMQPPLCAYRAASTEAEKLVNFGGRIRESTRKRMRRWAVNNDRQLQDLLEQVCTEWLDSHGG
jgi:hypothetical protein